MTFVDTSGVLAFMNVADARHVEAARIWTALLQSAEALLTTNYVLVETGALVQARMGMTATQVLAEDITPALDVSWVDEELHRAGMAALLTARRRDLSLVDCVSFEVMRRRGITRAFTFDPHFPEQGFEVVT
jgi:predicted nucleic acid-binding protein